MKLAEGRPLRRRMLADEYAPNFGGIYKSMPRDDGALIVFSLK